MQRLFKSTKLFNFFLALLLNFSLFTACSDSVDNGNGNYDGTAIEKPDADNTGYRNELATIIDEPTYYITDEGAILENTQVNGVIWIKANNVTIRDCLIDPGSTGFYGIRMDTGLSGITIEYCEIRNVVSAIILGRGFTMRRCYCHDSTGDAFKVTSGETETWLEWNFVEKLGTADGAHADGLQMADGGSNVTLYKNNIWMPAEGTENYPGEPYKTNACIFLGDQVFDALIDSNWLNGGGFTTYGWDGGEEATGVSFTNNRFGRDYRYNLNTGGYSEWSGNVFDDDDSEALPED